MKFWFSGEVDADVGETSRLASNDVERAINDALALKEYGNILLWGAIQIIFDERHGTYDEIKKFWVKKRETEFRLKIDHATFKATDDQGKRKLIFAIILRSIAIAREMNIPNFDFDRFDKDVREVGRAHGWL